MFKLSFLTSRISSLPNVDLGASTPELNFVSYHVDQIDSSTVFRVEILAAIALGQALPALQGRTDAAREIANRVEGRVTEDVEVSGSITYHTLIPHADRKKKVTS